MVTNEKTKEPSFRKGKLNLVDLAGSERLSKTGATGTFVSIAAVATCTILYYPADDHTTHYAYYV